MHLKKSRSLSLYGVPLSIHLFSWLFLSVPGMAQKQGRCTAETVIGNFEVYPLLTRGCIAVAKRNAFYSSFIDMRNFSIYPTFFWQEWLISYCYPQQRPEEAGYWCLMCCSALLIDCCSFNIPYQLPQRSKVPQWSQQLPDWLDLIPVATFEFMKEFSFSLKQFEELFLWISLAPWMVDSQLYQFPHVMNNI